MVVRGGHADPSSFHKPFLCVAANAVNKSPRRFALQLGDVIDGSNKRQRRSEAALRSVKAEIDRLAASLPLGVLNSLGNHELYNFPKKRWAQEVFAADTFSFYLSRT